MENEVIEVYDPNYASKNSLISTNSLNQRTQTSQFTTLPPISQTTIPKILSLGQQVSKTQHIDTIDNIATLQQLYKISKNLLSLNCEKIIKTCLRNKLRVNILKFLKAHCFAKDLYWSIILYKILDINNILIHEKLSKRLSSFNFQAQDSKVFTKIVNYIENFFLGFNIQNLKIQYKGLLVQDFAMTILQENEVNLNLPAIFRVQGKCELEVFKADFRKKKVVVKRYKGNIDENMMGRIKKEGQVLQMVSGKLGCFLEFYGAVVKKDMVMLVMEDGGVSLQSDIEKRRRRNEFYTCEEFVRIGKSTLEGLFFLQKSKVCHRDLRPSSIFISEKAIKIGGFSISEFESMIKLTSKELPKAINFISPELLSPTIPESISPYLSDVYSLGITFLNTIFLIPDFKESDTYKYLARIATPYWISELLIKMISESQDSRPSFCECLEFFNAKS